MSEPRVIKKYPNRRLYDTVESRYITLADIRKLATDKGAYELFVVGKTADGKLAGITFESVET
mgnify:CR=1 FL=1